MIVSVKKYNAKKDNEPERKTQNGTGMWQR